MTERNIGPATGAPNGLIGDLADWALEERKDHVDPDETVEGTWLGAISLPIFEGFTNEEVQNAADEVQERLDGPDPNDWLIDAMREAYGVGADWGGEDQGEAAEAAAVIAAAIYGRLGLEIPESNAGDRSPGSELTADD